MAGAAFLLSDSSLWTWWAIVLGAAVVVILVVAVVLLLIIAAARAIEREAGRCLTAAEQIASSTGPIWALDEVNGVASDIQGTARSMELNGLDIADALWGRVPAR